MKRYASLGLKTAAPALLIAAALGACSSGGDDDDAFGGVSGSTSTGSGGMVTSFGGATSTLGGSTSTSKGGGTSSTTGGTTARGGGTSTGGAGPSGEICNGVPYSGPPDSGTSKCSIQAEQEVVGIPVDMYIMMDRSSSMLYDVPKSNPPITRWDAFLAGMQDFVAQASTKDLRAGINFFGASPFGGDDALDCNVDLYATPKVEIAQVKDNGDELVAAINANQPAGLTPTLPALQGAIQHAKEWKESGQNMNRAVVVVFVTDGYPTQCQSPVLISQIADVAKEAYTNSQIRTFVIGLAAGFNLNTIAESGGTGTATLLDEGEPAGSLVDALVNITESKVACQYEIPALPDMTELDRDRVQLIFTPASSAEQEIPRIESAAACALNPNGGWYYDNPSNPKAILVCPCTCSRLNTPGQVRVTIGCEPTPGIR